MNVPKFLLSSNSGLTETLFVVHTEYPRFILNIINDEIFWLEEFDENEIKEEELEKLLSDSAWKYEKDRVENLAEPKHSVTPRTHQKK